MAIAAAVVLPLEPVVLMLISCSKVSRARWSLAERGRGACASSGASRITSNAISPARFISFSLGSTARTVAPGDRQCLTHGGLFGSAQHDVRTPFLAPTAGHGHERLGLGAHKKLFLLRRQP